MSYQAVSWALYDAPHLLTAKGKPDTTARAVLVVLAEHADEYGSGAHPSPLRIHYATGYDERTVQRALGRLELGKLIARDGTTASGTTRWQLALSTTRPDTDWAQLRADAEEARRAESDARKARRHRQASMIPSDVRDAESRTSGTQNPGVRDAESRMSGTQRHPNHQEEPSNEPPCEPPAGGAPPPDPRGPEDPSGPRIENSQSLSASQDLQQDQQSNYLPRAHAHAREDKDPPHTPKRGPCPHGNSSRTRRDGKPRCPHCRQDSASNPRPTPDSASNPNPDPERPTQPSGLDTP